MTTQLLTQIETDIAQLSLADQLWLMERLDHHIRQHALPSARLGDDLAAMAVDPAIQRELRQIEAEFAGTELDGLDDEL